MIPAICNVFDCVRSFAVICGGGCNGGIMDKAFSCYKGTSVATESSYPYRGRDGTCSSSYTAAIPKGGVTGYTDVSSSSEALMSALNNNPVSVAVKADQSWNCHFWLRHQPRPRCARRGLRQLCRLLPRQEQLGVGARPGATKATGRSAPAATSVASTATPVTPRSAQDQHHRLHRLLQHRHQL